MVVGALRCMNNADLKKVNYNIVLDVLNHLYQAKYGIGIFELKNNVKFSIFIHNLCLLRGCSRQVTSILHCG